MVSNFSNYSMYGPGITNDIIYPGYTTTMPPVNLSTFWSLPNGTIRSFGGQNQYTTYPIGQSSFTYNMAQNFMSPNHISQWNPMLFGVADLTSSNVADSSLVQAGLNSAYQLGQNTVNQIQTNNNLQNISNALNMMENNLSTTLKQDGFTAAQKATLEGLLQEVRDLKQKYQDKLKASAPTLEDTQQMQKEVQELQEKINKKVEEIRQQVADGGTSGSSSSSSSSSSSGSSSSSSSGSSGSGSSGAAVDDASYLVGTDYENIDPETGKAAGSTTPNESESEQICATIDKAVTGAGTDEDALRQVFATFNKDNVIEYMQHWDQTRDKSMIKRVLEDLNDGEQKEMVPMIMNALIDRANALGMYDEIKTEVAAVNGQLKYERHWYWNMFGGQDDDVIIDNINAIVSKIAAKEASNKTGAQQAIDKGKADHDVEVSSRRQEVEIEKKSELAGKIKEQLELNDVPTLSTALKVETDDNGEFTGYSIDINTPEGKITVKATTYQQLAVEIEKHNLKVEDVLIRNTRA